MIGFEQQLEQARKLVSKKGRLYFGQGGTHEPTQNCPISGLNHSP